MHMHCFYKTVAKTLYLAASIHELPRRGLLGNCKDHGLSTVPTCGT
jgi:hypothetical protein